MASTTPLLLEEDAENGTATPTFPDTSLAYKKNIIPQAADLTWQDDYYDDKTADIVAVFDTNQAILIKEKLWIVVLYVMVGVINMMGSDSNYGSLIMAALFFAWAASFLIMGILQPLAQRETHVAVTVQGVRVDTSFTSRLWKFAACSSPLFCPAVALRLFHAYYPRLHKDAKADRYVLHLSNVFIVMGIVFLIFQSKWLWKDPTVVIPFDDMERLGGTEHFITLILKQKSPFADHGKTKIMPRLQEMAGFARLVQAMMVMHKSQTIRLAEGSADAEASLVLTQT